METISVIQVETYARVEKLKKLVKSQAEYKKGFNPLHLYCGSTGRKVAKLNDDAIYMQLLTIPASMEDTQLLDTISEMNLIAARPSPAWVYQTADSIRHLIKEDSVGACVFYLTRAYQQGNRSLMQRTTSGGKHSHRWKSYEDHAEWNRIRIDLFELIAKNYNQRACQSMAELLLEVDARVGLNTCDHPKLTLHKLVGKKNLSSVFSHYKAILRKYRETEIRYRPDGNAQSREVYRHYEDGVRRKPTKAELVKRTKDESMAELNELFNGIMDLHTADDAIAAREADYDSHEVIETKVAEIVAKAHVPQFQKATAGFKFTPPVKES